MKPPPSSPALEPRGSLRAVRGVIVGALTRPYPVTAAMVALVSLVPLYIFIPELLSGRTVHAPALAWDGVLPLQPAWALVYGSLYLFLILLPVLVVRDPEHIRRTVLAYLLVWITAYVFFLAYPTVAPRPQEVVGDSFGSWSLRGLYSVDTPYNCFPSLHVAHSFVSALSCWRLDRRVGAGAVAAAALVGLSTLYTKQHYVLDVVAGVVLAFVAYLVFLHSFTPARRSDLDHRAAPILAMALLALIAVLAGCFWVAYRSTVGR